MYQIDFKTLSEIHEIVTSLQDHIAWLLERSDLEAAGRLLPTMKRLHRLVLSVYCQNSEEIDDALTPIIEQCDQLSQRLKHASTPEERAELEKVLSEYSLAIKESLKRSKEDTIH